MEKEQRIKPGSYVIINHTDKPCTRLIAQVVEVDEVNDRVNARYICKATNMKTCTGRLSEATLVGDFGVDLVFDGSTVAAKRIMREPSQATYRDGRAREWDYAGELLWQELRPAPAAPTGDMYVVGQLGNQSDDDPQFADYDDACESAKERSCGDQVWGIWLIHDGDDGDPELEALVFQRTVFTP